MLRGLEAKFRVLLVSRPGGGQFRFGLTMRLRPQGINCCLTASAAA